MVPQPSTTSRSGSEVRLYSVAFVTYGAVASPGTSGTVARPPVAITAFLKRSVAPLTSMVFGPVNRPRPWKTSTPAAAVATCASAGAIAARSRRMRSMIAPKSTVGGGPKMTTPNSAARRTSLIARAQRRSALEGTQPTLRQSPPARCSLIIAERAPRRPLCFAATRPPAPAPIAIRSYSAAGGGSSHPRGRTASSVAMLCSSRGHTCSARASSSWPAPHISRAG